MTIVKRSAWLLPMIEEFLDAPMPQGPSRGPEKPPKLPR
jgi:hypothetical protein